MMQAAGMKENKQEKPIYHDLPNFNAFVARIMAERQEKQEKENKNNAQNQRKHT